MNSSLEKFRLEEKIYLSCAKHRGNAELVAKELNIPYEFALKVCNKIRKRQDRDVNMLICGHIMGAVLIGRDSRIQYYTTMLNALEGRDSIEVSSCCSSILVKNEKDEVTCMKCGKVCNTYMMHQEGVYRTRMELLSELRKEDTALVSFSEKMGYTQKQDPAMVYKDERKYLIVGGDDNSRHQNNIAMTEKQKLLLEDAAKLSPMETTNLIKKIEAGILEELKTPAESSSVNGSAPLP